RPGYPIKLDGWCSIVGFTPVVLTMIGCVLDAGRTTISVSLTIFILKFPEVIRSFHSHAAVEIDSNALFAFSGFGSDNNSTIFGPGTIKRCGCGPFQDSNFVYIVRIDAGNIISPVWCFTPARPKLCVVHGQSVDDI